MSEREYVIFKLDKEEYGVDIMNVIEIIEYSQCTEVPNSPDFIEGLLNYRGQVVPIINLHRKFDLKPAEITSNTRIIIFNFNQRQIGILVEDASQVISINEKDIEDAPPIILDSDEMFISGIGKVDNKMIIILDLHNLLTKDEESLIKQI